MSEEVPPASDAQDSSPSLGPVPPKREPETTTLNVPLGGGSSQKWNAPSASAVAAPVVTNTSSAASAKPVIIGLSVAAAGLAVLSGYEILQVKERQQMILDSQTTAATLQKTNKTLDSDLRKAREDLGNALKEHQDAISKKDGELRDAKTKAAEASDELAKQEEKVKELENKIEAAGKAVQEKERLESELTELKKGNEDLVGQIAKAEQQVQRLTDELASRKIVTPVSTPPQDPPPPTRTSETRVDEPEVSEERPRGGALAWRRLGKYETGKDKGRWYYVAPDGFVSPLYDSRELAVYQAELRAGCRQPDFGMSGRMGAGANSNK